MSARRLPKPDMFTMSRRQHSEPDEHGFPPERRPSAPSVQNPFVIGPSPIRNQSAGGLVPRGRKARGGSANHGRDLRRDILARARRPDRRDRSERSRQDPQRHPLVRKHEEPHGARGSASRAIQRSWSSFVPVAHKLLGRWHIIALTSGTAQHPKAWLNSPIAATYSGPRVRS